MPGRYDEKSNNYKTRSVVSRRRPGGMRHSGSRTCRPYSHARARSIYACIYYYYYYYYYYVRACNIEYITRRRCLRRSTNKQSRHANDENSSRPTFVIQDLPLHTHTHTHRCRVDDGLLLRGTELDGQQPAEVGTEDDVLSGRFPGDDVRRHVLRKIRALRTAPHVPFARRLFERRVRRPVVGHRTKSQ